MVTGVKITKDKLGELQKALDRLAQTRVMVGVPAEGTDRGEAMTNAALAYIHDNGAPEVGIPARPFLRPGIKAAKGDIEKYMKLAGQMAMDGKPVQAEKALMAAGMRAASSIRNVIAAGIPPPLAPATIARRAKRSKGSKYRRKAGSAAQVTPLIDTGQLLKSITYVLRRVK